MLLWKKTLKNIRKIGLNDCIFALSILINTQLNLTEMKMIMEIDQNEKGKFLLKVSSKELGAYNTLNDAKDAAYSNVKHLNMLIDWTYIINGKVAVKSVNPFKVDANLDYYIFA